MYPISIQGTSTIAEISNHRRTSLSGPMSCHHRQKLDDKPDIGGGNIHTHVGMYVYLYAHLCTHVYLSSGECSPGVCIYSHIVSFVKGVHGNYAVKGK